MCIFKFTCIRVSQSVAPCWQDLKNISIIFCVFFSSALLWWQNRNWHTLHTSIIYMESRPSSLPNHQWWLIMLLNRMAKNLLMPISLWVTCHYYTIWPNIYGHLSYEFRCFCLMKWVSTAAHKPTIIMYNAKCQLEWCLSTLLPDSGAVGTYSLVWWITLHYLVV